MRKNRLRDLKFHRGTTFVEYALVLVLIAVNVLLSLQLLESSLSGGLKEVSNRINQLTSDDGQPPSAPVDETAPPLAPVEDENSIPGAGASVDEDNNGAPGSPTVPPPDSSQPAGVATIE